MYYKLRRWFWRLIPHRHVIRCMATKYGSSCWCERCGWTQTMMDVYPWGD
jgi:hypothetical protein